MVFPMSLYITRCRFCRDGVRIRSRNRVRKILTVTANSWRVPEQQPAMSPKVAVVEFDQALAVTRNNPHIYFTQQ